MAVTTYNIDTTIAQLGGKATDTGTYLECTSDQGSIEFDITGTEVDLYCYSGYQATNLNVAIDGATQTKPTVGIGSGNVGWVTAASGLTDARHTVKIWADNGVGSIYVAKTNGVRVTGSAPAVQKSAFWGPTLLVDSTQFRTYCDTTLELETDASHKGFYSSPTVLTGAHMDSTRQGFSGVIAFRVSGATYVRVWLASGTAVPFVLNPNDPDTDHNPVSSVPSTNARWITLSSSLDPTGGVKEYWIVTEPVQQIYAIQTDGAFDTTAAVPVRKRHHAIGDSTMICDTPATDMNGVVGRGWIPRVCARVGVLFRNWGIDGTKVSDVANSSGSTVSAPIPTVVALASEISAIWVNYGINDYGASDLTTTFEPNYEYLLNYLLANVPNAPIRVADMFDIPSGGYTTNIDPHLVNIVSAVNSPLVQAHHWSGFTWNTANTSLGGDTTDGTHQNISGNTKLETSAVSTLTITSGTVTGDAAPTSSSVTNTWTSATGGYAGIFTAQMQRSAHGAGSWSNITGATASPATDATVAPSTSYDYRVVWTETATGRTTTSNTATVNTPASGPSLSLTATPNPVTGTTTTLDDGETGATGTITRLWTCTANPGAAPTIASPTAGTTSITFIQAGDYTFHFALTADNGSASGDITVTVDQMATTILNSPSSLTLAPSTAFTITASELDQFGNAMAVQPAFTFTMHTGASTINSSTGAGTTAASDENAVIYATADSLTGITNLTVKTPALNNAFGSLARWRGSLGSGTFNRFRRRAG